MSPALIHLSFEAVAFFIAYRFYKHLKKSSVDFLTSRQRTALLLSGGIGALLISRAGPYIEGLFSFSATAGACATGKTIVGALVGGVLGIEICKLFLKIRESTGDLYTFPLILGMIIGRIGCFLTGSYDCTFGDESSHALFTWDFGDGRNRIAWQLVEIYFLLALSAILYGFRRYIGVHKGLSFKIFLFSYLMLRMIIDFHKPLLVDPKFGLSFTQWIALLGILFYAMIQLRQRSTTKNKANRLPGEYLERRTNLL